MAMSRPQPISVFMVSAACAALFAGATVLFIPAWSFFLLCWGGAPDQSQILFSTESAMVFALLSPAIAAVIGLAGGALMAMGHNVFAHNQHRFALQVEEFRRARAASLGNVA
jgi:hypothetical protein